VSERVSERVSEIVSYWESQFNLKKLSCSRRSLWEYSRNW